MCDRRLIAPIARYEGDDNPPQASYTTAEIIKAEPAAPTESNNHTTDAANSNSPLKQEPPLNYDSTESNLQLNGGNDQSQLGWNNNQASGLGGPPPEQNTGIKEDG